MKSALHTKGYFTVGILLCFFGAVFFSTKAVLVKLAYRDTVVDAVSLLALRMVFSLPFFFVSALASSRRLANVKFTGKEWLGVAFVGCLGYYISSLLDILGLQYISAGIERLILFIYPMFVMLIMAGFFKHRIRPMQMVALVITYSGLVLAYFGEVNFSTSENPDFLKGSLLVFMCAITFASYVVGTGRLIPLVGAVKFNSYAMMFACGGVLLHFFIAGHHSLFTFPPVVYGYGLLMQ